MFHFSTVGFFLGTFIEQRGFLGILTTPGTQDINVPVVTLYIGCVRVCGFSHFHRQFHLFLPHAVAPSFLFLSVLSSENSYKSQIQWFISVCMCVCVCVCVRVCVRVRVCVCWTTYTYSKQSKGSFLSLFFLFLLLVSPPVLSFLDPPSVSPPPVFYRPPWETPSRLSASEYMVLHRI